MSEITYIYVKMVDNLLFDTDQQLSLMFLYRTMLNLKVKNYLRRYLCCCLVRLYFYRNAGIIDQSVIGLCSVLLVVVTTLQSKACYYNYA